VVIDNLDVVGVSPFPTEANPPLVIDPNAVLAIPSSAEPLEMISRWHAQIT